MGELLSIFNKLNYTCEGFRSTSSGGADGLGADRRIHVFGLFVGFAENKIKKHRITPDLYLTGQFNLLRFIEAASQMNNKKKKRQFFK